MHRSSERTVFIYRDSLGLCCACAILFLACASGASGEQMDLDSTCKIIRGDHKIVLAQCGTNRPLYLFTREFVANQSKRVVFNRALNGLALGDYYRRTENGQPVLDERAIRANLPSSRTKGEFLEALYSVRDAAVWADGGAFVAYEILALEIFRPEGLQLLNQAIFEHAVQCNAKRMGELQIVDLVLHLPPGVGDTFRTIAECDVAEETVGPILIAAVGLARLGELDQSKVALEHLRTQSLQNEALQATIQRVSAGKHGLPEDQQALRQMLSDWLDLPVPPTDL